MSIGETDWEREYQRMEFNKYMAGGRVDSKDQIFYDLARKMAGHFTPEENEERFRIKRSVCPTCGRCTTCGCR